VLDATITVAAAAAQRAALADEGGARSALPAIRS